MGTFFGEIAVADVYLDCEWTQGDYLTILGAYSPGQDRFQLYGRKLTRNRLSRFLNRCCDRNISRYTLLFCHGPDIGRIVNHFDLRLKEDYYCINTVNAFRTFTNFGDCSLGHLEQYFELPRKYVLSSTEINDLWNNRLKRRTVLDYNWEDCMNLWRLVNILKSEYGVTRSDFKRISMEA